MAYPNVAFITLTNSGYIDYTLNCLKSLDMIEFPKPLHCYCIGEEGYNKLKEKGYTCSLLSDEINDNFQEYRSGNWSNIVSHKFDIIYENLKRYDYVCITDGDIVFENKEFMDFLLNNIGENDILSQSEMMDEGDKSHMCSGFILIQSTPTTLQLFNPVNVERFRDVVGWGDQLYLNDISSQVKYDVLPLSKFPNGRYYYANCQTIKPYMIHFNWVVGHEKRQKMIEHEKWYM